MTTKKPKVSYTIGYGSRNVFRAFAVLIAAFALAFAALSMTGCDNGGDTGGDGTAPTITTATLPNGTVGTAYSEKLAATGDAPITWSIESGALPTGLSLSGNTISGTPSEAKTFGFTVKATNTAGNRHKALSITIVSSNTPVINITVQPAATTTVKEGEISGSLSVTATATDGVMPLYQWYQYDDENKTNAQSIDNATAATFAIPTRLTQGDYYYYCVISAEGAAAVTSNVAKVIVTNLQILTPANFTVSNNTHIYDGNAKAATVNYTEAEIDTATAGTINVTYTTENDTTEISPANAGTYDVLATTTGGTAYAAFDKTKVGTLTINKATGNFGSPAAINTAYTTTLKLSDLTLAAGYAWNAPTTSLNAGDGQTFAATFTDPSGNYETANGNITVNVAKANGAITVPTLASKTENSITVTASSNTGQTVQYGINTTNAAPNSWQASAAFEDLTASTEYHLFAKAVENDNYLEAVSAGTAITTEAAALEYWNVTWNLNGGTAGESYPAQVVKGAVLTKPANPTKANATFIDWYLDPSLTQAYAFASPVTDNLTLYAKWQGTAGPLDILLGLWHTPMDSYGDPLPFDNFDGSTFEGIMTIVPIVNKTSVSYKNDDPNEFYYAILCLPSDKATFVIKDSLGNNCTHLWEQQTTVYFSNHHVYKLRDAGDYSGAATVFTVEFN